MTLSALSLSSFAGGIAGVASGLPLGFQGGFPRCPAQRIPHRGPLARLSGRPHERQLRRLAQRPGQQPDELHWPTSWLFAQRYGHRELSQPLPVPSAARQRRGSRQQTSLGLPAPIGPSSHLRLRSGGRQNQCSWTCSSQFFTHKKTAPRPRDRRFQIGARRAIFQAMEETKLEKLARLSGKATSKALDALGKRGFDIRGKLSAPISRVPRRVSPLKAKIETDGRS